MKRQFLILVETATPETEKAITSHLRTLGSWWHWISNAWLLVSKEEVEAKQIRDQLNKIAPDSRKIVIQVRNITWAGGRDPQAEPQDMFEWMNETWDKANKAGIPAALQGGLLATARKPSGGFLLPPTKPK